MAGRGWGFIAGECLGNNVHLPRAVAGMLSQVLIRKWYACGSMNIILVAMARMERRLMQLGALFAI